MSSSSPQEDESLSQSSIKSCIYDIVNVLYKAMVTVENFDPKESQQHLYDIMYANDLFSQGGL